MARYAVLNSSGLILQVFDLVEPHTYSPPNPTWLLIEDESGTGAAKIGGTWDLDNLVWVDPPTDPPPATLPLEKAVELLASAIDHNVAFIQTSFDEVQTIPSPAINAPPAVAASSALGTEPRYALENHEHGINATQQSQISALQSNVSSLLSLTGGLNTPAPATATPAAGSGSGVVGTSAKYAREDHAHPAVATPLPSNADPLVSAVTAAQGTSDRYSRQDHVHPNPGWTVSTPSRALNGTAWQPSTTKWVLCVYSVRITCTASLAGGQDGKVELMSDSGSTPTTVRGTAQNRNSVSLAIALTAVNEQTIQLAYLCPPNHYVRLLTTQTTGTPTFALVNAVEIAFA